MQKSRVLRHHKFSEGELVSPRWDVGWRRSGIVARLAERSNRKRGSAGAGELLRSLSSGNSRVRFEQSEGLIPVRKGAYRVRPVKAERMTYELYTIEAK